MQINKILGGIAMKAQIKPEKSRYIDSLKVGQILAFNINGSTISGKVVEIADPEEFITIETKNKTQFIIRREDIVWVKTGQRWPKGVFQALKGEKQDGQQAE